MIKRGSLIPGLGLSPEPPDFTDEHSNHLWFGNDGLYRIQFVDGDVAWLDAGGEYHREDSDLPAYISAGGDKVWYVHGIPGRRGGKPHKEFASGDVAWLDADGQFHNEDPSDLPAYIFAGGDKVWYVHGIPGRCGGKPHGVGEDGTLCWLDADSKYHREESEEGTDLPAVIYPDGTRGWFVHGIPSRAGGRPHGVSVDDGTVCWLDANHNFHRDQDDLPAVIDGNGDRIWCLHGVPARSGGKPHLETVSGDVAWMDEEKNFHRDENDLPAYVAADGEQRWFIHGIPGRANGKPHVETASGTWMWMDADEKLHREDDLPAYIKGSRKKWYRHGTPWRRFFQYPGSGPRMHATWQPDIVVWTPPINTACCVCMEEVGVEEKEGGAKSSNPNLNPKQKPKPLVVICQQHGHGICEPCLQMFMEHVNSGLLQPRCPSCRGPLCDKLIVGK